MNFWEIYILVIVIIYLAAFFIRNLKTYFSTKASIRGNSINLTLSLILSTVIYLLTIFLIIYPDLKNFMILLNFPDLWVFTYVGYVFILIALLVGLAALYEMKNSWRVGIKYDQKTELITTGVYSFSRNPYFLSYDLLFLGIVLIIPSLLLLVLVTGVVLTFHFMILEEESYLEKAQGKSYLDYKNRVGRYIFDF